MSNALGIIFSNMHDSIIGELTAHRCMGSIPVGGRYRLIDFALSSFVNSGIEDVGVITKNNFQSLMDHLGTGREWDLSRKRGGLVILPPYGRAETGVYRGRVEALQGIMQYIVKSNKPYVLATDCDYVANIEYREFIRSHEESGADITVMYTKMDASQLNQMDMSVFALGDRGQVVDMLINPRITGMQNVYMNTFIVSTRLLERIVDDCFSRNQFSFDKDVLQSGLRRMRIMGYEFDGYYTRYTSMQSYFENNMVLLEEEVREALFPQERPIYTKVRDEAPVRYGLDAQIRNSFVADGCTVEGLVENSILFRGVYVGKGAQIKNSIVMQDSSVGTGAGLDYVITDKNVAVRENRTLMGFRTYPVYIAKGSVV